MRGDAQSAQLDAVCDRLRQMGLTPHAIPGRPAWRSASRETRSPSTPSRSARCRRVEVIRVTRPYKLTSREVKPDNTVFQVGRAAIGGKQARCHRRALFGGIVQSDCRYGGRLADLGADLLRGGRTNRGRRRIRFRGLAMKRSISSSPPVNVLVYRL